jgi:uncharacterized membrane protein YgdD (TMEM256/DUF423 family)
MYRPALIAGALFAGIAVILGAFGAHALKDILAPDQLQVFETGVRYQFYHSFALLVVGILYSTYNNKLVKLAASFFISGIILFSGSLYLMTMLVTKGISLGPAGVITPIGGLAFILGWIYLLAGLFKKQA